MAYIQSSYDALLLQNEYPRDEMRISIYGESVLLRLAWCAFMMTVLATVRCIFAVQRHGTSREIQ